MTERVSNRFARPQARQTQAHAAVERAARPGAGRDAGTGPELNRRDRVIVTLYVALAVLVVLFVAATAVAWGLGG
jgi:hypothetical protein